MCAQKKKRCRSFQIPLRDTLLNSVAEVAIGLQCQNINEPNRYIYIYVHVHKVTEYRRSLLSLDVSFYPEKVDRVESILRFLNPPTSSFPHHPHSSQ